MKVRPVSIVIPFYNRLELLDEAVISVAQQTYDPIELVLVDDDSDERVSLDRYEQLGLTINYLRNSTNVGPAMSRFVGLNHCKGEYVAFLDSDDVLAPTFVEKQVLTLEKGEDTVFAYCFTKLFNRAGIISDRHFPQVAVDRILPDIFLKGRVWCTSACLWNRSFLIRIEPFDGYAWEDYRMDVSAALINNHVGCTPEYLCFYRVDSDDKLSVNPGRNYAKLLYSVDGILQAIWESHKKFPEFDCVIAKMANKYLTCLIKLNDDPAIDNYCVKASHVRLLPLSLRYSLLILSYFPEYARLFGLRLAKRVAKRAMARKCQNAT